MIIHTPIIKENQAFDFTALKNRYHRHGMSWVRIPIDKLIFSKFISLRVRAEKDGPAFSPCIYEEGKSRGNGNVKEMTAIVFDIDNGTPFDEHFNFGVFHVAYTSWSHTPELEKWRLIFPLAEPIPVRYWRHIWPRFIEMWNELVPQYQDAPDKACKDAARLYYLPAVPPERRDFFRAYVSPAETPLINLECEESDIKTPLPKPTPQRSYHADSIATIDREIARRLREEVTARIDLAHQLGCTLRGDRAEDISCPSCNRRSMYYYFEPSQASSAFCAHKNSCGANMTLFNLARHNQIF